MDGEDDGVDESALSDWSGEPMRVRVDKGQKGEPGSRQGRPTSVGATDISKLKVSLNRVPE